MANQDDKNPATEAETTDSLLKADGGPAAELTEGQLDSVAGGLIKLKVVDGPRG